MIVAGVGFRNAASAEEIEQVVRMALNAIDVSAERLDVLATEAAKAAAPAFAEAARRLDVPTRDCALAELEGVADRISMRSERAMQAKGVPSIAEACALVTAGSNARLLGARMATRQATCAIAIGDGR